MLIQVNSDRNVTSDQRLEEFVSGVIEDTLDRFSAHITRVEVHLSDENASKGGGDDKRCALEVRLEERQPLAVTDRAESIEQALNGAVTKMKHLLETTFGKERSQLREGTLDTLEKV